MNYIPLVVSALLAFIVEYLLKYIEPKSRFVIWLSHKYEFSLPNPSGQPYGVYVQTVRFDNLGRFPITDVEIVHKMKLDHFAFDPPQPYEESTLQDGSHLISIKSIAPHSGFSMQYFCYAFYPNMLYTRSKQGYAEVIPVMPSIVTPKWKARIIRLLVIVGLATCLYWFIQLLMFLVHYFFPVK